MTSKIRWVETTHRVPHLRQCTACELQVERGDLAREITLQLDRLSCKGKYCALMIWSSCKKAQTEVLPTGGYCDCDHCKMYLDLKALADKLEARSK